MRAKGPAACLSVLLLLMHSVQSRTLKFFPDHVYNKQNSIDMSIEPDRNTCIGCVLLVSVVEQLAQVHNSSVQEAMGALCSYLPDTASIRGFCTVLVELFGPDLIKLLNEKLNADVICHAWNLCSNGPNQPICHLYEAPKIGLKWSIMQAKKIVSDSNFMLVGSRIAPLYLVHRPQCGCKKWGTATAPLQRNSEILSRAVMKICSLPLFKQMCEAIESSVPLEDFDHDNFSAFPTLRGYHWRGRDCSDLDKSVYPGRSPEDWDALRDSNCNGIWGFDPEDGIPYEKKYCEGTDSKGIIILGDSAAAHFHVPPEWLTALDMSKETFSNLPLAISNEFDWPQFSLYTGYQNSTIGGWTSSLYLYLRKRNLCNHRDYQNIGRNGGESANLQEYIKSLARNQQLDKPAVVFYALIGNDVCNYYADTLSHMTTPRQMHSNVMKSLDYLDSQLPKGSHVVLVALADGRFLWDTLHDKYHPIGQLNKDVTYRQIYSFLSCLSSNPCEGWMNKNETLRNLTTERARQLSDVLKEIATSQKFNNFDVVYMDNLYQRVIEEWKEKGKDLTKLIEPVDGFHPSQIASALGADLIWQEASKFWPDLFGKENPYNDAIRERFGDQGGH